VTQQDTDPREELPHPERLRHVVIGARVERRHLVGFLAPRGQDEDGHRRPLAQAPDDLAAVDVGQAEIEDDDGGS
jgi:hypothetical protein